MTEGHSSLPLIGVDTGGTFTDLVLVEGQGIRTWKLPSTPDDPARAVLAGVRHLLGDRTAIVCHGSTVATNALLEGKGARVVLVVTAGFGDLLRIGRQNRPHLYALHPENRPVLVPSERTVEVQERVAAGGQVIIALSDRERERVVAEVQAAKGEAVALCLLHSYARPDHEVALEAALTKAGWRVSASHRILPEYREFERASTTAVNAAVSPVMDRYLSRLKEGLKSSPLRIMQSNGGTISAETAGNEAVRTILSGPAGGMVGAFAAACKAGYSRIITFDMGGTSTDVGLCDGAIPATSETILAGWPVKVPMIDLHTVGAGGGSLARFDAGGALRVGPESAGADPGPACYGRGDGVTVTDANLYLGRLRSERFLGGRMELDEGRCRQAMEGLAAEGGLAPRRLAEGILEVAEAAMAGALRVVSVARGHDPREFTLVPFGGAGGLHACALAETLAIPRILIPRYPGLLSALGLILADTVRDYSLTVLRPGEASTADLEDLFRPLADQAKKDLAMDGEGGVCPRLEHALDLRYRGQSFEVTVPWSPDYLENFHRRHEELYGFRDDRRPTELVNLRLRATVAGPRPEVGPAGAGGPEVPVPERAVMTLQGEEVSCQVFPRAILAPGATFLGPALITEETATHLIRVGWKGRVDDGGNLILERN